MPGGDTFYALEIRVSRRRDSPPAPQFRRGRRKTISARACTPLPMPNFSAARFSTIGDKRVARPDDLVFLGGAAACAHFTHCQTRLAAVRVRHRWAPRVLARHQLHRRPPRSAGHRAPGACDGLTPTLTLRPFLAPTLTLTSCSRWCLRRTRRTPVLSSSMRQS